ncbi:unnamed protein product, partial [Candidula unifasciata]
MYFNCPVGLQLILFTKMILIVTLSMVVPAAVCARECQLPCVRKSASCRVCESASCRVCESASCRVCESASCRVDKTCVLTAVCCAMCGPFFH